jgi:hypothetical protein
MLPGVHRPSGSLILALIVGAVLLLWLSASFFGPAAMLAEGQPPPPPPPPDGETPVPTATNTVALPPPIGSPTPTSTVQAPQPPAPPGESTATPGATSEVPPPPPPELPRTVRLWADYRQRQLVYEFTEDTVYAGPHALSSAILYFDGRHIYRGSSANGELLFTATEVGIDGWRLFAGATTAAPLAYTIEYNRIRQGGPKGHILYYINHDDLLEGPNKLGTLVFHTNIDLRGSLIVPLLPLLAEGID